MKSFDWAGVVFVVLLGGVAPACGGGGSSGSSVAASGAGGSTGSGAAQGNTSAASGVSCNACVCCSFVDAMGNTIHYVCPTADTAAMACAATNPDPSACEMGTGNCP